MSRLGHGLTRRQGTFSRRARWVASTDRLPGRDTLLLVGVRVGVEHDDGAQGANRGEDRGASPDDDAPPGCRLGPGFRRQGHKMALALEDGLRASRHRSARRRARADRLVGLLWPRWRQARPRGRGAPGGRRSTAEAELSASSVADATSASTPSPDRKARLPDALVLSWTFKAATAGCAQPRGRGRHQNRA